jgi:hypothetical protein
MAGPDKEDTMTKLADTLRENTVGVARHAYKPVETKVLVAEGKKSMRKKGRRSYKGGSPVNPQRRGGDPGPSAPPIALLCLATMEAVTLDGSPL